MDNIVIDHVRECIKKCETLRLKPYDDGTGVLTAGWGHTSDKYYPIRAGGIYSMEQAEEWFEHDIREAFGVVARHLKYTGLNGFQIGALVSIAFNSGGFKFLKYGKWVPSKLMILINEDRPSTSLGNHDRTWELTVGDHIEKYKTSAGGTILKGLIRRRRLERMIWDTEIFTADPQSQQYEEPVKYAERLYALAWSK